MSIILLMGADRAYRQERVSAYFRPWRRVGATRTTARSSSSKKRKSEEARRAQSR